MKQLTGTKGHSIEELLAGMLCHADNEKLPTLVMDTVLNQAYLDSILKKGPQSEAKLTAEVKRLFPKANKVFIRPPSREEVV